MDMVYFRIDLTKIRKSSRGNGHTPKVYSRILQSRYVFKIISRKNLSGKF